MLKNKRLIPFVIILFCISIILTFNQKHLGSDFIESDSQYLDPENPKISASWILPPFIIDDSGGGDYTWVEASNNTWCSGAGTWADPYIIENVTINGLNSSNCLEIKNSNVYFIIKNSALLNSSSTPLLSSLLINNVTNGIITNNTFKLNPYYGISISSGYNITILKNVFYNNSHGIVMTSSTNNMILNNNISGINPLIPLIGYGINLFVGAHENLVSNNRIENIGNRGITVSDGDNNTIINNFINNTNGYGGIVFTDDSHNNTVKENKVYNTNEGIYLYQSNNDNKLLANVLEYNNIGIRSIGSSNNVISGNTIQSNGIGILFHHETNNRNTITHNFIANNNAGVQIQSSGGENNSIYNNNFSLNNAHASDNGNNNHWNDTNIGNYWDDYLGSDQNDDGIGDTPYLIPGSAGAQDNFPIWDDGPYVPPPPPEPFDNTFLMILLLSVPLGLLGLITGQSFGKRRKYVKLYGDLESESGWTMKLEDKKREYNKLSTEIKKIEKDQDLKLQELQEQINIKEDYLLEGRVEQRISYYKEYNEIIQTFEEMKDGLETEILSKTQLKKNVIELKKAKKAVEEKLEQIKKEHNSNLKTIQEVIRKEEEEWKNKRSEKKTKLELEFKSRENNLEQEREVELQKIHVDIQEEIQRRIQEQKRDALKEKRDDLIRRLKVFEENFLDEVEARIQKLKADMPNFSASLSSKSGIKDIISTISFNISTIEDLINDQRNIESVSDDIIKRISRINKNIRSISSKMELQRASPVFAIPSKDKGLFYTTLKMDFRCELCHKLIREVEVKERNKWLKWSLLGIRSVLEFVKLDYINPIVEFTEDHLIGEVLKEVSVDLSSESRFFGIVQELKDRKIEPDINLDEKVFDEAIKNKDSRKKIETYIVNHHKFFVDKLKPVYTLQDIQDLCDKRERIYWQIFSQDEQENIRRFLKESGNSSLYTTDLQLKYGIFVCNDCESWIENLEDESYAYRGEN